MFEEFSPFVMLSGATFFAASRRVFVQGRAAYWTALPAVGTMVEHFAERCSCQPRRSDTDPR